MRALAQRIGYALAAPLLAVAVALTVSSLMLLLSGNDPIAAFGHMIQYGVFGRGTAGQPFTIDSIVSAVDYAIPLYIAAMAAAVGFRAGLFNIGVDGQYRLAALVAAAVGGAIALPGLLQIAVIFIVAIVVGALWASIAAVLKVTRGVSEVISTLVLNFIATGVGAYLLSQFFRDPAAGNQLQTRPIPANAHVPSLDAVLRPLGHAHWQGTHLFGALVLAIVLGVAYHVLMSRSRFGFELRANGMNPLAARASGVRSTRMTVVSLVLSGAIAGLAGMPALLGSTYTYGSTFPPNYGFDGIAVALLGRFHPLGMAFGALLFGFMNRSVQIFDLYGIPKEVVQIMQGTLMLSVVIAYGVVSRARRRGTARGIAGDDPGIDEPVVHAPLVDPVAAGRAS
jgi:simple sugar transport system permease protein